MRLRWRKLGLLYCPPTAGRHPKLMTHAANPLPVLLDGDVYRIFYSGRDADNRSSVGAVDVDVMTGKVVREHHEPFFLHGPEGSFFADGVSIGNCYVADGRQYMLFMGWQNPPGGHWRGDIGRLSVSPALGLALADAEPLISNSATDPISLSYSWVMPDGGGGFQMWYGSTLNWDAGNGEMLHVLNRASSKDGHHWECHGLAVPYEIGLAQAFSRPTVARTEDGRYAMWFSYRSGSGQSYRIGAAFSDDGIAWRLALDEAGIDVSAQGWDSDMIEYPFVFDHKGRRLMLYNGNGFGRTGFGLAILEA
ncbi:hypothetical protein M2165_001541 [Variovorax sp. TBS-050B]|nr:hypothetical protein [Variovorax sp. TBS-050B]